MNLRSKCGTILPPSRNGARGPEGDCSRALEFGQLAPVFAGVQVHNFSRGVLAEKDAGSCSAAPCTRGIHENGLWRVSLNRHGIAMFVTRRCRVDSIAQQLPWFCRSRVVGQENEDFLQKFSALIFWPSCTPKGTRFYRAAPHHARRSSTQHPPNVSPATSCARCIVRIEKWAHDLRRGCMPCSIVP